MTARMTPRRCDLVLTSSQKFAAIAPIVIFLVFPIVAYALFVNFDVQGAKPFSRYFPWLPLGFLAVMAVIFAWTLASIPYRLTVTHDQHLEFQSLRNVRKLRAANVLSIKPRSLHIQANMSGYELEHRDGKFRFPGQLDGLHEVLHELKLVNPTVKITGC